MIRWRNWSAGRLNSSAPLWCKVKDTSGLTNTIRSNSVNILLSSVWFDFRNLRRAGTLKNKFFTLKLLPFGQETASCPSTLEPDIVNIVPNSSPSIRVRSSTWATAAIEAKASPRNPMVCKANKSAASRILEVAWRSKDKRASVSDIPFPSSITWMEVFPASTTNTSTCWAPASIAFSTNSLITDAGRWITSPAAIWLATESGSKRIISLIYLINLRN